jgi:hypothetical protein
MPAQEVERKYAVGPEHYGQCARQNGVFIAQNKRCQHFEERTDTRKKDQARQSITPYSNKGCNYQVGQG